ncbi:hypothetical protein FQA39_LY10297 [Lamprigera yunnana]|nr:hypothetical protein FQA39_LY10297 [Lamprigera yunnana]
MPTVAQLLERSSKPTFDSMWKPRQIGAKTLTFEMIKEKQILRIENMCGNEFYLDWESVSEVWSLESVLSYRLSHSSEAQSRYKKSLTDEELLLPENDNYDLNIFSGEVDDPGGWDNDSEDEVPDENAKSVPMAAINPEVNAQVKKQDSGEYRQFVEEMEVAIFDAPPAASTSESRTEKKKRTTVS